MNKKLVGVYLSIIFATIFWAFSFVWYKEVLVLYKPISLVLMRLVISSILLFTVAAAIGKLNKIKRKDIKPYLLLGLFQPFLYFLGESYGVSLTSSTLSAVIIATIPLFTPLVAFYLANERITVMNFFGIIVSVIGVGLVIFHQGLNFSDINPLGIAFLSLAVVSAIAASLIIKKLTKKHNAFSIVAYQNLIGIFYFLPLFFILDYKEFVQVTPTWDVIIPLLNLGVFASTLAFIFFTHAIKHLGVSKASIFTNGIPAVTAIFAYFVLDEKLTILKIIGILVVFFGLLLSQLKKGTFSRNKKW
ncbi:MAG: DMT family transporter [Bacteroidales bacterium]|jgi:drug/metabolite transporter (DMT)-like permease|nr:DMT family transporter [Bacteroidales bacterium]MDD4672051.1 DMT family transporter [Bacteroidales bacterium]MDY0347608.1 DMT family transporter [Tenuifilaceae bacterium]